jgi:hypothetical protein
MILSPFLLLVRARAFNDGAEMRRVLHMFGNVCTKKGSLEGIAARAWQRATSTTSSSFVTLELVAQAAILWSICTRV